MCHSFYFCLSLLVKETWGQTTINNLPLFLEHLHSPVSFTSSLPHKPSIPQFETFTLLFYWKHCQTQIIYLNYLLFIFGNEVETSLNLNLKRSYLFMILRDSTVTSLSIFLSPPRVHAGCQKKTKKQDVAHMFDQHWFPLSGLDLITFLIICRALHVHAQHAYSMMLICFVLIVL